MPVYTDQLGNTVDIPFFPQRIVSLVPSQTELLFDLGLDHRVIGITKFCVHPGSWFRSKTRVGGTKSLKNEVIAGLQPDLILANKEENVKEQVNELARHYPVWTSDIHDLESAMDMIERVGGITGCAEKGLEIVGRIRDGFAGLAELHKHAGNATSHNFSEDSTHTAATAIPGDNLPSESETHNNTQKPNSANTGIDSLSAKNPQSFHKPLKTAYLIWRNPFMTIGGDTFIHDMLNRCGLQNIFDDMTRYPEVTIETLRGRQCELLLLSSEPYPFKQNHIDELQEQLPGTKILLADGEMFSWYGSRLLKAPEYFIQLLQKL